MRSLKLLLFLSAYSNAAFAFQLNIENSRSAWMHRSWLSSTISDDSVANEELILSGPPAITVRDLTCTFDGGDNYQLNSASYVLPRGARVGLVG